MFYTGMTGQFSLNFLKTQFGLVFKNYDHINDEKRTILYITGIKSHLITFIVFSRKKNKQNGQDKKNLYLNKIKFKRVMFMN